MSTNLGELGFALTHDSIQLDSPCYRPPSWPPPKDWIVSMDASGECLSRWGDSTWDFSPWAGNTMKLQFGDGGHQHSSPPLGPENQHLMRLLTTWLIWGPRGVRTWRSLRHRFRLLRRLVVLCDREGILASELMRFPKVLKKISNCFPKASGREQILVELDRLLGARELLGFVLVDKKHLAELAKFFGDNEAYDVEQTAYIPARIWTCQVSRLRECLEDFLGLRIQVENCFQYCLDAYVHNFGSLTAAYSGRASLNAVLPFGLPIKGRDGTRNGRVYHGTFEATAQRFGILPLLQKWVGTTEKSGIKTFQKYLSLVQFAGMAYIANFTLQRSHEVWALRKDCLLWEKDEAVGRVAIICGETTKTDPDSDARWPTSPTVQLAVDAMTIVAELRMRCAVENPNVECTDDDIANPFLVQASYEPWGIARIPRSYSIRPNIQSYKNLISRYPLLFNLEVLRITEDDLNITRRFTPNLDKRGAFKVGAIWPLAFHQLRRTGGVNMFASGLLSDSSIQMIMKHLTLLQTSYYGRNHTRLRFSEDVEGLTVAARYEVMAKQIEDLVSDRYVSPGGVTRKQEIVVNLVGERDLKKLVKAGKNGEISFRETRLGGCARTGHCDYGGIESVERCAGGSNEKPCLDAVFDKRRRPSIVSALVSVEEQLRITQANSPRFRAMEAEKRGMMNFLKHTND